MYDWSKMKKVIILIPVFNDWDSLKKLIDEINDQVKETKDIFFNCLVVNDASTIKQPELRKPGYIKSLKILNMKQNKGHARCNAFGIRYVNKFEKFDHLILMDGDSEDRPVELQLFIKELKRNNEKSIVAKRIKRSEGPVFRFLYSCHKILTFLFTGKTINFGNYSCLTKKDVEILSSKASLWSSFSGSVKKNIKSFDEIKSTRGLRYFGPSKMSLFKLIIHSFSIIAVFKYQVFLRSFLILVFLSTINLHIGKLQFLSQILLLSFNIIIFLVSLREKKDELLKSQDNLKNIVEIRH